MDLDVYEQVALSMNWRGTYFKVDGVRYELSKSDLLKDQVKETVDFLLSKIDNKADDKR